MPGVGAAGSADLTTLKPARLGDVCVTSGASCAANIGPRTGSRAGLVAGNIALWPGPCEMALNAPLPVVQGAGESMFVVRGAAGLADRAGTAGAGRGSAIGARVPRVSCPCPPWAVSGRSAVTRPPTKSPPAGRGAPWPGAATSAGCRGMGCSVSNGTAVCGVGAGDSSLGRSADGAETGGSAAPASPPMRLWLDGGIAAPGSGCRALCAGSVSARVSRPS